MEVVEGYRLCSGCCIGVRCGKNQDELVLSFELGAVQVYQVSVLIDSDNSFNNWLHVVFVLIRLSCRGSFKSLFTPSFPGSFSELYLKLAATKW